MVVNYKYYPAIAFSSHAAYFCHSECCPDAFYGDGTEEYRRYINWLSKIIVSGRLEITSVEILLPQGSRWETAAI